MAWKFNIFISSFHLFIGSIRIGGKSVLMDPIRGYISGVEEHRSVPKYYFLLIALQSSINFHLNCSNLLRSLIELRNHRGVYRSSGSIQ